MGGETAGRTRHFAEVDGKEVDVRQLGLEDQQPKDNNTPRGSNHSKTGKQRISTPET